ncbi:2-amino-4-hydroxy-6-hydroxymethyldihydropteridine pyrophosphokinase [Chthoniobacter flavus Ellin428]|uniref:2-amino-4-hydroxy-6-hydroxymethyldihydropteridine pyrophosphokinase n=1 Tax=Chthoniobacter flavus Ellin428 TaxID=497964 RepID=B4CW37_9BACT|nr:2-amino-4-hydroxy-6-hydroxymethyldihydropteridine diphosphokinase [Chthoniobacter flavus]EDY21629.1 2-amino-4-hydroxy-6-hydroxymethyldihydropteridine pyrophosphokinase [Chthoniobacter flavus Ellin428]TCO95567.1 2-amino-4-hydroxy-6-hydroxymethyldihydropteridine diphosphokinase [Chthoniobacter flavus]
MRAGIALGSNLGDRLANLRRARALVLAMPGVSAPVIDSRVYETEPVQSGPDAGAYLNTVIEVEYEGQPITLLDGLQHIEAELGRPSKRPRNAPRTIDLDILYAGNLVLSNEEVVIPHPRLHQRRFVLTPLADIRPDLILPGQQLPVSTLLSALIDPSGVELYSENWI